MHAIGRLANAVRERLHGDKTFFNRNRHINYTNVCALSCKFCSFYRKRGEDGAYDMRGDSTPHGFVDNAARLSSFAGERQTCTDRVARHLNNFMRAVAVIEIRQSPMSRLIGHGHGD